MLARICFCAALLPAIVGSAPAAAQTPAIPVTLQRMDLDIVVHYDDGSLTGSARLGFRNHESSPVRRVPLQTHRLMEVSAVTDAAGNPLEFAQDVVRFSDAPAYQFNQVYVDLPQPLAPGDSTTIALQWTGILTGYTETGMLYVRDRIDTTFTILRSETQAFPGLAVPSASANRRAPRADFAFAVRITVPANQVVATGGRLVARTQSGSTATYEFRSTIPVPFLNIVIAPYRVLERDGVRLYYFPADSAGAQQVMEACHRALDTLTQWFGPMGGTLDLAIMEIPDGYGSQASLSAGIIQTAAAFRSKQALGQLYHELSHLWNARDNEPKSPRWNEGLASFLEGLLMEKLDGWSDRESYAQKYAAFLLDRVAHDSLGLRTPFIDYGNAGITGVSYGVGYFMFTALYESLGPQAFNRVVGGYYQTYRASGGTMPQFVELVKKQAPCDLTGFFNDWVYTVNWYQRMRHASSLHEVAVRCDSQARH